MLFSDNDTQSSSTPKFGQLLIQMLNFRKKCGMGGCMDIKEVLWFALSQRRMLLHHKLKKDCCSFWCYFSHGKKHILIKQPSFEVCQTTKCFFG